MVWGKWRMCCCMMCWMRGMVGHWRWAMMGVGQVMSGMYIISMNVSFLIIFVRSRSCLLTQIKIFVLNRLLAIKGFTVFIS